MIFLAVRPNGLMGAAGDEAMYCSGDASPPSQRSHPCKLIAVLMAIVAATGTDLYYTPARGAFVVRRAAASVASPASAASTSAKALSRWSAAMFPWRSSFRPMGSPFLLSLPLAGLRNGAAASVSSVWILRLRGVYFSW